MSLKPKIIATEELNSAMLTLQVRKEELTLTRDEALARLNSIEQVLKENKILEAKTHEQVSESVNLYLEEWIKMREFYPEVRLGILQKTLDFVMPADPKKK